ncbi:hypothetical protein P7C73_g3511, partial [Tremellales sp. Uapishka_1]
MGTNTLTPPSPKVAMQDMIMHVSLKMAQTASMLVPPLYILTSIVRRNPAKPFTISRLMRVSTVGVVAGGAVGAGMGYMRLANEPEAAVLDRTERLAANRTQVRTDDYSLIGAALSGLLVPAVLLKRAPLPYLVLGGASIGLGLGVWTHLVKSYGEGEDVRPEGMVGEIPVIGGNDK